MEPIKSKEPLRISAKQLGQVELTDFCERCFWVKMRCGGKPPFQTPVPGIFSSLDAMTKRVTRSHFEKHGHVPRWLDGFGELGEPVPIPHHTRFCVVDPPTAIKLTGVPDEIFKQADGTLFIADNKTAKWNDNQQRILPMYRIQLNAYGYIAERIGMGTVRGLGLVYHQPQTEVDVSNIDSIAMADGFSIRFSAKLVPVRLDMESIPRLLQRVRSLADLPVVPDGRANCKDCALLNKLVEVIAQ
jgi:hypothetical protein